MHATTRMRNAAIAATLALLAAAPSSAQEAGTIAGSVADAAAGALPGVTVTLTGGALAAPALQVTGPDGRFAFETLPAGDYVLAVALPGFETQAIPVAVQPGETAALDVVMALERRMETITVVAEEPRIFARNVVAEPMLMQQSNITAVTSVVDNLPGVSVQEGRRVRLRRLVEQRRHARLPGDHQRGADRHHHRRLPERHVRLLERLEGEPVHRPDEPRRRRGLAGHGRHRLALGRGAGRHVRLPDGRPGGRADLHRVDHPRRERGPAVRHADRHRTAVRPRDARLDRRGPPGGDRLGGGLRAQRARARRRQARLVARAPRPDELLLVRQHPRGRVPAALQRRRLPGQPALGPPDRRLARRAVPEPVLPARLADPAQQHVRLPQGGVVVQRGHVAEPGHLLPSEPGPRRLAAPLHRRRHRRRRRTGVGADGAAPPCWAAASWG